MRFNPLVATTILGLAAPLTVLAQGNTGPAGNPQHDARGQTPPEMVAPEPGRGDGTGTPLTPAESQAHLQALEAQRNAQAQPHIRADDLELRSASGERLGEVEDVMLDSSGELAGYVVETGGVLGVGERHLFVPRSAVRLQQDAEGRARLVTDEAIGAFQQAQRDRR
jgi:hypothetical protein